jgi:hypothetical protein
MKAFRIAAATMALGTSIAIAPGLAQAHKKPKHPNKPAAAPAAKNPHGTKYIFRGVVVSTPAPGATTLTVQVRSGNKAGVTLLGANPTTQTFSITGNSALYSWNAAGTSAAPAAITGFMAGDPVAVTVWGGSRWNLQQVTATPATRVDDVLNSSKPAGRLFIFVAKVVNNDPATGGLTVNIVGGNWRALHAFAGQPVTQTFHYSTTSTVFLNFNGQGKAHLINPVFSINQTVVIRVFSANYDSETSSLLNLPAWRINAHEPARMLHADIKKNNAHNM